MSDSPLQPVPGTMLAENYHSDGFFDETFIPLAEGEDRPGPFRMFPELTRF